MAAREAKIGNRVGVEVKRVGEEGGWKRCGNSDGEGKDTRAGKQRNVAKVYKEKR